MTDLIANRGRYSSKYVSLDLSASLDLLGPMITVRQTDRNLVRHEPLLDRRPALSAVRFLFTAYLAEIRYSMTGDDH